MLAVHFRSAVALAGNYPVLAGVDLDVEAGDVVLLQGANGAGKTSILRACAGLLAVSAGTAEVLGTDVVADPRAVRRRVGLMGHATGLYDDLNAEENVTFSVRAGGGRRDRVGPALERLGLGGRLRGVAVSRLSAGQRRRVALAVLLARDADLWLLDEPHAGLDAEHRDLLDEVVREAAGRGATVLFASHEVDRAGSLARRVVTVAGGTAVDGTLGQTPPVSGTPTEGQGGGAGGPSPAPSAAVAPGSTVRGAAHVA